MPSDQNYKWRTSVGFNPSFTLLKRLLLKSINNAHLRSECDKDCYWSIYSYDNPSQLIDILSKEKPWEMFEPILTFNCNKNCDPKQIKNIPFCHSRMFIESKALFAVLTGITHWNNFEIGSVFQVRREPDIYVKEMTSFINFLSVI